MSELTFGTGKNKFAGQSITYATPIALDPAQHVGAVIYADDGDIYYSNGTEWKIPNVDVDISRPTNLIPTTAEEQTQLRLNAFRSPTGVSQTGIVFQINADGIAAFGPDANLITRTVTSPNANLYQLLYPEDGFVPGDTIWWRAFYTGTDETQSEFSLPTAQTFPDLITTPTSLTAQNAVTGTVTLSAFESPTVFGLEYLETEVEFYALGDEPGVDTPITTVTPSGGAVTTVPIPPLAPGASYQWRGRYGGRANVGAPTVYSDWSATRTIFLGAASIILEYDIDLMISRTAYVPINTLGNPLKPLNVTVEWGDGTEDAYTTAGIKSHIYATGFNPTGGLVTVTITGTMDWYGTAGTIDQSGLVRVDNIGFQMGLESMRGAFRGTKDHLIYITPNIPETVTSFQDLFHSSACAADLSNMDTRNIQNFAGLFTSSIGAGPNCAGWDVRNVTNVNLMCYAGQFNNAFSLGNWESLVSMENMFASAISFNTPIGYWDVSNVTNMQRAFARITNVSTAFNQDIGAWDVSNVTNFEEMFGITQTGGASGIAFNNGGSDSIKDWSTSSATTMHRMFGAVTGATGTCPFNQPIGSWDVSGVTDMSHMFNNSVVFNQPISSWDVSNITNMQGMFSRAAVFNQPLANWDVSSVTDMSSMFDAASAFDQNLGAWNVSNVTDMGSMFAGRPMIFNNGGSPDINNWDTSAVTDMSQMFSSLGGNSFSIHDFNQPIGNWNVSNVVSMSSMFYGRDSRFNQDISTWDLRAAGVDMSFFMGDDLTISRRDLSQENYSRLLTAWGNRIADVNSGPLEVSTAFKNCVYNTTPYQPASRFTNAAAARTYLVAARALSVSGSSDPDANGSYPFNSVTGAYINSAGWYFLKSGSTWTLYDATNTAQATGTGNFPWKVDVWTGVLSATTVLSSGAGWTITGDVAA